MSSNQPTSFLDRVKQQAPPLTRRHSKGPSRNTPPLEEQISRYMNSLTKAQRERPWSVAELLPHLTGQYRQRPAPRRVAQALQALGWVQRRDWTKAGRNRRLWLPSRD